MTARARETLTFIAFIFIATCFASHVIGQIQQDVQDLSTFPRTTLEIHTKPQAQKFNVWIANTPARQAQGLMFVRELPPDEGMIFPNEKPRVAAFWMKNTYISLDLLFVAPDGRIVKIAANAKPLSLETISSGEPISAVLELKAGESARRGVKVGDSVSWASEQRAQ
jgi:uncharacterized membrane protein (UPF0127 family)